MFWPIALGSVDPGWVIKQKTVSVEALDGGSWHHDSHEGESEGLVIKVFKDILSKWPTPFGCVPTPKAFAK